MHCVDLAELELELELALELELELDDFAAWALDLAKVVQGAAARARAAAAMMKAERIGCSPG